MDLRRRRTDRLPAPDSLPADPLARGRVACDRLAATGIDAVLALQVPDDGGQGVLVGAAGRVDPLLDLARGLARRAAFDGGPITVIDTQDRIGLRRRRHAAIPLGAVRGGQVVLVISDPRLSQREGQAIAAWAAPSNIAGMQVDGGPCGALVHGIAKEFDADVIVLALFAQAGMLLRAHARSGGMLGEWRVPHDTVWGEVARHGAAFTLGDLPLHAGAEMLASLGMHQAALVGLENGHGIAVGAMGLASATELDLDIAYRLLDRGPLIGPQVMELLSSTAVPVPDEHGTVDVGMLAARVGCQRFAMYERDGTRVRLVAAHDAAGKRLRSRPDDTEEQLVCYAVERGIGVASEDAAAILLGTDTVLYAQDPVRRPLDRLRLALGDLRRNPFGPEEQSDVDVDDAGGHHERRDGEPGSDLDDDLAA